MELQERYIAAGLKHIPPTEKDGVEKAMRRIIAERLQERGNASEETEREVLRGLGSPRILAEKQLREPPHLIGPELYGTYMLIVKIVMTVAVIGTLIGNTVDFIVNGETILRYIAQSFAAAIGVAIGAFGWVTLVFAIMEKTAKQKILTEIQEDWSLADLQRKKSRRNCSAESGSSSASSLRCCSSSSSTNTASCWDSTIRWTAASRK